jgi:hypothetical protein
MTRHHAILAALVVTIAGVTTTTNAALPYARSAWQANLPPGSHASQCVATVIDDRTIQIEHFTYDGGGPAVYFYLGAQNNDPSFANGLRVGSLLSGTPYNDDTLTLTLDPGESLDGYTALAVWCDAFNVSFTSASFVTPLQPYPRAGWQAELALGDHDTEGTLTIINDHMLFAESFSYDGTAPAVYFYLGVTNDNADFAAGLELEPHLDRAYADESLVGWAAGGADFDDYAAVSVWCAAFNANFTSATLRPDIPGDENNSGMVDGEDLDTLASAMAGVDMPFMVPLMSTQARCIGAFDQDEDLDLDLEDVAAIQRGV